MSMDPQEMEEVLKWSIPLAMLALEDHRLLRLRYGHSDIGAGRERNKTETLIGLYDSEVSGLDRAKAMLLALHNPDLSTPQRPEPTELELMSSAFEGYIRHHRRVEPSDSEVIEVINEWLEYAKEVADAG